MLSMSQFRRASNVKYRHPMSDEEIRRVASAAFAEAPRVGLSERYSFLPTSQVISALRAAGWQPVCADQGRARDLTRVGVQRHAIRFAHPDFAFANVGDSNPELVLMNSHDGTSAFQLFGGIYRKICSNGMIVSDGVLSRVSVRHSNRTVDDVVDASFEIVKEVPKLAGSIDSFRQLQLTSGERHAFAEAASQLRWDVEKAPVAPPALLQARRYEDNRPDMWSTLNTVQENIIRGGLRGRTTTGKRTTTRAVASVSEDTKLNRALWHLAEEMRRLKGAA